MSLLKKLQQSTSTQPGAAQSSPSNAFSFSDEEFRRVIEDEELPAKPSEQPQQAAMPLESDPTETIFRLFGLKPDTQFTFATRRLQGEHYLNAMRQVMSRVRRIAKKEGRVVVHWKVLVVDFKREKTHDLVTIIRTQNASIKQRAVFDTLMEVMNDTSGTKG